MTTVRWQKNEDALRRLIDGMAALVTAHSPEGELEFANRQLLDYVGKTVDQLKDWRTNGEIHPDDLDTVDAMWTDCMQTGRPYEHVNRYRCADGEYHWFHAGGRPERDEQGRIVRWYVVLTDIEEARVSERDRIARDLHDTLLQSTEGLILKVHVAMQRLSPGDPLRLFLARSVEQAERLAVEGRQKLLGLTRQPFAPPELSQAFAVLGKELSAGTATRFRAVRRGRVRTVATTTWDEVFSIAREGITHSQCPSPSLICDIQRRSCRFRQEAYTHTAFRTARYAVFHTGPSATGDIEGVLIHGAQGVRSLTVILDG